MRKSGFLFIYMIATMVIAYAAFMMYSERPDTNPFAVVKKGESSGNALLGGPFTLKNQNGEYVSNTDLKGKWMLVYFGYSFCPDVCPADLLTMTSALEALDKDADKIAPLFITIDPERDTVDQLNTYMSNFYPSIQALTGSPEEIAQVANAYKVYYKKVEDPDMSYYLMDHTAITYLMDTQGNYVTHFAHGTDAKAMTDKLKEYVTDSKK